MRLTEDRLFDVGAYYFLFMTGKPTKNYISGKQNLPLSGNQKLQCIQHSSDDARETFVKKLRGHFTFWI